ncbi:hypothetical protein CR513_07930, partial [Mucuna pruriens]
MTPFPSYFTSYLEVSKEQLIIVTNGNHVPIVGSVNVQLQSSLSLHNILHVSKLANNLISIHRLIKNWNCAVAFFRSHCVIQELTTESTIGVAKEQGNNTNKEDLPSSQRATSETWAASQILLYHKCLGHPRPLSVIFVNFQSTIVQHFLLVIIKVLNFLTLFILMCGGQQVTLYRGLSGLLNICRFFHLAKNQFGKSIKRLRSDNSTEFVNLEFSQFFKDNGVVHELTCVN